MPRPTPNFSPKSPNCNKHSDFVKTLPRFGPIQKETYLDEVIKLLCIRTMQWTYSRISLVTSTGNSNSIYGSTGHNLTDPQINRSSRCGTAEQSAASWLCPVEPQTYIEKYNLIRHPLLQAW